MNRHAKALAERALRWTGLATVSRAVRRHRVAILAYHNVVPQGEPIVGDRSLHIEQHRFAQQLDWLRRTYDVVPLPAIFDERPTHGRPRAAITFDDAYRGAVTAGVKELVDRDMPATIFVAPRFIGGSGFWWDLLTAGETDGLPTEIRQHCVHALEGRHDRVLAWAKETGIEIRDVPPHQAIASEEELATCLASGKITLASHTWSHPNLARIHGPSDLEAELRRPLEWLQARFNHVVPWLAYPYGIGSSPAASTARRLGFHGAFLVSGGLATPTDLQQRRFMIPRLNVPSGLSLEGLVLRSSGIVQ